MTDLEAANDAAPKDTTAPAAKSMTKTYTVVGLIVVVVLALGLGLGLGLHDTKMSEALLVDTVDPGDDDDAVNPAELNRVCNIPEEIEPCDDDDEAVSVFGHKSADSDSVCSAIIYAWELQNPTATSVYRAPICAKAHISSALNIETEYILHYLKIESPPIIEQITADTVFALVDTNNVNELPDTWPRGNKPEYIATNLHSVVDHHKLTGLTTDTPIAIDIRPLGSAGSVLYQRSKLDHRPIPGAGCQIDIAGLMLSTILSDTLNLTSRTTTSLDIAAVAELAVLAGIDDTGSFFDHMMVHKSDMTGISAMDLVTLDSKVYDFRGPDGEEFMMRLSVFESVIPERVFDLAEEIQQACDEQLVIDQATNDEEYRAVLFFLMDVRNETAISFCGGNNTYVQQLVLQGVYSGIIGAPLEDPVTGTIALEGLVSRKLQILPGITIAASKVSFDNNTR